VLSMPSSLNASKPFSIAVLIDALVRSMTGIGKMIDGQSRGGTFGHTAVIITVSVVI